MNDYRLEAALKGLGRCTPKAPEASVEAMIKTVRALNNEKSRRMAAAGIAAAGMSAPEAAKKADKEKELTPLIHIKKPGAKVL